jgi:heme/copper-type cytochrome/quinol oxidase subunit 3
MDHLNAQAFPKTFYVVQTGLHNEHVLIRILHFVDVLFGNTYTYRKGGIM